MKIGRLCFVQAEDIKRSAHITLLRYQVRTILTKSLPECRFDIINRENYDQWTEELGLPVAGWNAGRKQSQFFNIPG